MHTNNNKLPKEGSTINVYRVRLSHAEATKCREEKEMKFKDGQEEGTKDGQVEGRDRKKKKTTERR